MPSSFADLGVPRDLVSTLRARGIHEPFPIQALTIEDSLAGRDLCGRAPTGSGKTLAFGIPMAARIQRAKPRRPHGLVLVPTRELAAQVQRELTWLGAPSGLRVAACYGGVGLAPQRTALRRGVDVLVACPGRLADLVERRDADLGAVQVVVVDEADRMADMGFLPQVRRLLDLTPADRQTLLFSATLDGAVDELVRRYQRDHVVHRLPEEESRALHHFWKVEQHERVNACAELVRDTGSTIVFCRTRRRADRIARQLAQAGLRTAAIHGDRSQAQRDKALAAFTGRKIDALVATDVAARGIHVDDVACVVHFDPPNDAKDYTHRSGRTARAGNGGTVVSFVGTEEATEVKRMQRDLGVPVGFASTRETTPGVRIGTTGQEAEPRAAKPSRRSAQAQRARPVRSESGTPRGTVRWFNSNKGYGFIGREVGDDLFVHRSAIEHGHLADIVGKHVEFEIGPGKKGEQAHNVRVLASASA